MNARRRLGPYALIDLVDTGGMGEVWRAHDPRMGRDVAIKRIREDGASNPVMRRRFVEEARAAGGLAHANVLVVFDVGEDDGSPFLVTELLEGESLRTRLLRGPLPVAKVLDLGAQIASGLAAAHDRGIVHRDIKPANLFLARDGRAKILDFGIARLRPGSDAETGTALTESGARLGTAGYMSPEQIDGREVDARSDLFSLGCVLYEMATGQRPFAGSNAWEINHGIVNKDPEPWPEKHPVPASLKDIIQRCLEKLPEQRIQSARDLAFMLNHVLPDAAARKASPRRKTRWTVAAAFAVTLAGMSAAAWYGLRSRPAPTLPSFQQLTFRQGSIRAARFFHDGRSFAFNAAWDGGEERTYLGRVDQAEAMPLDLPAGSLIQSVSARGELALLLPGGTLARAPLSGGSPRPVTSSVVCADWSPDGAQLAAIRNLDGKFIVEYPLGTRRHISESMLSDLRVSPDGRRLAYCVHGVGDDSGGHIEVLDAEGKTGSLSPDYSDVRGVAWSPNGREVWFAAAGIGTNPALYAASPGHSPRLLFQVPTGMILYDTIADGSVLCESEVYRVGAYEQIGSSEPRDISWMTWTVAADLHGDSLLVFECSEAAGIGYAVGLRVGNKPVVRLGDGVAGAFSPDGSSVVSVVHRPKAILQILPTGVGAARIVDLGPNITPSMSTWLRDNRNLLVWGSERGGRQRCWLVPLAGGSPKPLPDEFLIRFSGHSPDGRWVVGARGDSTFAISVDGAPPRLLPLRSTDLPFFWDTNQEMIVREGTSIPARMDRVNLVTGARRRVALLGPHNLTGMIMITTVHNDPRNNRWVYTGQTAMGDLHLIRGLE